MPLSRLWLLSGLSGLGWALSGAPLMAGDAPLNRPTIHLQLDSSFRSPFDSASITQSALFSNVVGHPGREESVADRWRLQIDPLLDGCVDLMREAGIPVQTIRDPAQARRLGISASFNLGEDLPPLTLRIGKALPELFGAFTSAHDLSWALIWPVRRFTLLIEGAERREFGYFGVAGVQWTDERRPLAFGLGIPINVRRAVDQVGIIFQFRMRFD